MDGGLKWAEWLHRGLERYTVPPAIVGTPNLRGDPIEPSLYPIFRDDVELPPTADLTAGIENALRLSDHLIVLCSPRSALSPWVRMEVRRFKEMSRSDRIIAVIIAGEPNCADGNKVDVGINPDQECFCEELRFGVQRPDGTIDWSARANPLAADLRDARESNDRDLGLLKIAAAVLHIPLGVLTERDAIYRAELASREVARLRTFNRRLAIAAFVALLFAVAAGMLWRQAGIEQQRAEQESTRATRAQAIARREATVAGQQRDRAEREEARATAAQQLAERETEKTRKALKAANAAASGLVAELVAGTANWPEIHTSFRMRILVRAQLVLLAALTASDPTYSREIRRSLGIVYSELASVQMESGHVGLANEAVKAAEDMFTRLRDESPRNIELRRDLGIVLRKKGEILSALDQNTEAAAVLNAALKLAQEANADTHEMSVIHGRLGMLELNRKNKDEAVAHFRLANRLLAESVTEESSLRDIRGLAASHLNVANVLDWTSAFAEVERHLDLAERLYAIIVSRSDDGDQDTELMQLKLSVAAVRAEAYEANSRQEEAIRAWFTTVELGLDLIRANPENSNVAERTAANADRLANILIDAQRKDEATRVLRTNLILRRNLIRAFPDNRNLQLLLTWTLMQLSIATGTEAPFDEARELLDKLAKAGVVTEQAMKDYLQEFHARRAGSVEQ